MNSTTRIMMAARIAARYAKEHPSEEARKKYLEEHPKADPKNHTVDEGDDKDNKDDSESGDDVKDLESPEGRKRIFGRLKGIGSVLKKVKSKVVEAVKDAIKQEAKQWASAGKAIYKLVGGKKKWKDLDSEERRYMITEIMHTTMMFGAGKAILAIVPPPAGYAVKQALSAVAFRLIDRKFAMRYAAKDAQGLDDVVQLVIDGMEEAVQQLTSGKMSDKDLKEALAAVLQHTQES